MAASEGTYRKKRRARREPGLFIQSQAVITFTDSATTAISAEERLTATANISCRSAPPVIRSKYPICGTTHTYYDYEMLCALRRYVSTPDGSAAAFHDFVVESRADAWWRLGERYYEFRLSEQARRAASPYEKSVEGPPGDWPPPPVVPSRQVWGREYVKDFECRRQGLEAELGEIYARAILRVDHTGAVARKMRSLAGKWIVNLMNEDNQIATYGLAPNSARDSMAALVQGLRDRHISAGADRARLIYIDRDCCSENERKFWNENWAPGCVLKLDILPFFSAQYVRR